MKKKAFLYAGSFILVIVLSVSLSSNGFAEKDTLVIGLQDNSVSLDPAVTYEEIGWAVVFTVYERLVTFKEGDYTQFAPELAESWEIGSDGRTWTFHLRKGARFSSGNPMNADAVVFSLHRALTLAKLPSWVLTQFGLTAESITKIDDFTVQITLDKQYAPALFLSALVCPVASILDPQPLMESEQDGDLGSAWLDDHSAGSGPYAVEERKRGEQLLLKANQHYWRGKPGFEQVILRHIGEPVEQMSMLEQGVIDMAWNLQPEQILQLKQNPEIRIREIPSFHLYYLNMNLGYVPLAKSEVRDAIRYAIDYDGMIEYILGGAAKKIQTFIPEGLLGYNPAMPYNYDIQKAKQLLAEAGYPDGFEVELTCFNWSPWIDVAMKIKSDLANIGINVSVKQLPAKETLKILRQSEHQLNLIRWMFDYADPDANAKPFAHSDSPGDEATVKLAAWRDRYVNPETAKLVEQAAQEFDTEKRKALYTQITAIILDDGPFAFLYSPIHQYAIREDIADRVNMTTLSLLYDVPVIQ